MRQSKQTIMRAMRARARTGQPPPLLRAGA
jgi:hypothetical protein